MKRNTTFIFAGVIAAITATNAYATGENTVTSKSYVDAEVAAKQDKIPSKNLTTTIDNTELDVPSIVLYPADGTNAGAIGETGFASYEVAEAKSDELLDMYGDAPDEVFEAMKSWLMQPSSKNGVGEFAVSGYAVALALNELRRIIPQHMTCAGWPESVAVADRTDANCWLWNKN